MANPLALILHASAAETASGASAAFDLGPRNALRVTLDVSAHDAGSKVTIGVESSPTGTGAWKKLGQLPALTVDSNAEDTFGSVQRYVRITWTIEGTSVTFGLTGEAHVTYAAVRDIGRLGISVATLAKVSTSDKVEALIAASDTADRYLCREFTLPLVSWGNDLRRIVTHIAVYDLMCVRGFQPEGADALIVKRYDDAIAALREVGDGKACMPGIEDSDDSDDSASDGAYDVACVDPSIFFSEYPFGEDLESSTF